MRRGSPKGRSRRDNLKQHSRRDSPKGRGRRDILKQNSRRGSLKQLNRRDSLKQRSRARYRTIMGFCFEAAKAYRRWQL